MYLLQEGCQFQVLPPLAPSQARHQHQVSLRALHPRRAPHLAPLQPQHLWRRGETSGVITPVFTWDDVPGLGAHASIPCTGQYHTRAGRETEGLPRLTHQIWLPWLLPWLLLPDLQHLGKRQQEGGQ